METAGGIAETFKNGTFLITGSTGFLGKILVEKLLRSCSVKNMAIIVRNKKGFDANQRVADIYRQSLFDRLRNEKPDFMNNIKVIDGNIEEEFLGLSAADRNWIIENVNFVFHCAATIKFNEPLELAAKINIQGTRNLLTLATQMRNLKGFVHVSTAYSHCPRAEIKEQYYQTPITAMELKNMSGDVNELTESNILGNWPNTYTFTKAITENLISTNENRLPISIFRPSIIGCTEAEPEPGWLENLNGPTGILTGVMVGFLRTVKISKDKVTDIIPADYTANALISVMWDTVKRYQDCNQINEQPKIYNYVSSIDSPLTFSKFIEGMHNPYYVSPPLKSIWYGFYILYTNSWIGVLLKFFLHRIPAVFMDFLLIITGKRPKMLKMYAKAEGMLDLLQIFITSQWKFDNSNTFELLSSLSIEDREQFKFSMENFNWEQYTTNYYYGIRKHILHEDLSNIVEAKSRNRKLFWLHKMSIFIFLFFVSQLCWICIRYICTF